MLENIEQLFGMFAVIGALYASSEMVLVAESSDDMMMFTSLQQAALNVFSYQACVCIIKDCTDPCSHDSPLEFQHPLDCH